MGNGKMMIQQNIFPQLIIHSIKILIVYFEKYFCLNKRKIHVTALISL